MDLCIHLSLLAPFPREKIKKQKAIITKAEGNILMELNDMPLSRYLEHSGLMDAWVATVSFPLVIDYNDGTKPVLLSSCFSCLTRYPVLGMDTSAELEQVGPSIHNSTYQFCYSGGEICPVYVEKNKGLVNRFHNCTLIACVL
jgi:hypothetical protein